MIERFGQPSGPPGASGAEGPAELPETAMAVVVEEMERQRVVQSLPAVAYGLTHRGGLVGVGACTAEDHPGVDEVTRFRASSLTKSITAATVLLLRDRGLLELHQPVAELVPEAATLSAATPQSPVRIEHLLTMTVGLPMDDPWIDELDELSAAALLELVGRGVVTVRPPGTEYEYSNVGYALLGCVISAATGTDFREVIADEVLDPVGMDRTGFAVPPAAQRVAGHRSVNDTAVSEGLETEAPLGAFAASGGLWSCVTDLARWLGALDAGIAAQAGPLPAHIVREMASPRTLVRLDRRRVADEDIAVAHGYGMGLFTSTYSDVGRVIFHQGGSPGFGAELRLHPASRWGVVAMANRGYPSLQHPARRALQRIVGPNLELHRHDAALRSLRAETVDAMAWAESLLASWDEATFSNLGAATLDRQVPRETRRARFEGVAAERGPFVRDEGSLRSTSPAHALWRMEGHGGDAWLEVLLTPTLPVRVQHVGLLDSPEEARAI